jgi:RNA polymerase sigma factor (TIGR02999 family)
MSITNFSLLFEKAQQGDWGARDAVYKLAYGRLRSIASALLQRERPGHTLQPTALVGELYLKLNQLQTKILSEDHFFRLSARAMRQVLIDRSRSKASARRVGTADVLELMANSGRSDVDLESLVAVRLIFDKLKDLDPGAARCVWLRAVEGLTLQEVSQAEGREIWRVRADLDFGIQWMTNRLASGALDQAGNRGGPDSKI